MDCNEVLLLFYLYPKTLSVEFKPFILRQHQEKLQTQRGQIENQLSDRRVELASPEVVSSYVKDLRRVLEESELTEKGAFIRSFIKKIKIMGQEAFLTYTMPINRLLEEKIGVLPIAKYCGRYYTVDRIRTFELTFSL